MANIEKRHIINSQYLSGEFYFNSILQEAQSCGLLNASDMEKIQLQCINLLAYKTKKYTDGESSSVRTEIAECFLKSNFYTIGLYLKSLPNPDIAVDVLKKENISEIYEKGRKLLYEKFKEAKNSFNSVQRNKLKTINYLYQSTLGENGIIDFFKSYNKEYRAHEVPVMADYQLFNPVKDLTGVEFIQQYLENLFLENEFCGYFKPESIHYLLYGYDKKYSDLPLNIFEIVLTEALGCSIAERNINELNLTDEDINFLNNKLQKGDFSALFSTLNNAMKHIFEVFCLRNPSLRAYIESSLPEIAAKIETALKLNTLNKVFITPKNPDTEPKIYYESADKMDDKKYRKLIEELIECRFSSDKFKLIKDKVQALDDIEELLFDAHLNETEIYQLFDTLEEAEIAIMVKRHPFVSDLQTVDLSETEQGMRIYLENYIKMQPQSKQKQIFVLVERLIGD